MSHGASYPDLYRRAAVYFDKILNGHARHEASARTTTLDPGAVRRSSGSQKIRNRDPIHHGAVVLQQFPHLSIFFRFQVHAEMGAELAPM